MSLRTRCPLLPLAVLLTVTALGGCGDEEGATPGSQPVASPTPTSSPTPGEGTSTPPSEGLEKIRVVGEVVSAGDCVVVRDDNEITWTLTGDGTRDLAVGDRVRATGAPQLAATGCGGPLVRTTSVTVVE